MTKADWSKILLAFGVLALGWFMAVAVLVVQQNAINEDQNRIEANQKRISTLVVRDERQQQGIEALLVGTGLLACALAYADERGEDSIMDEYAKSTRLDARAVFADYPTCLRVVRQARALIDKP